MSLTAWTQNAWGEAEDLEERLVRFLGGVNAKNPGILFLQELFTPLSRYYFDTLLRDNKYFVFHAVHKIPQPPLTSFLLPLLCYLVVGSLASLTTDLHTSYLVVGPLAAIIINPYSILFAANLLFPLLFPGVRHPRNYDFGLSFMATCTCFSKDKFSDAQVLEERWFPHSIRGYPVPPLTSPGKLLFYYVQHTFFRPLFTVSAGSLKEGGQRVLAVNCHLVIGNPNLCRVRQVALVLSSLQKWGKEGDIVVIAGDFNADADDNQESCFDLLRAAGYVDSISFSESGKGKQETWKRTNRYMSGGSDASEPEARLDYVWVKGATSGLSHSLIFKDDAELVSDHFGVEACFSTGQENDAPPRRSSRNKR